MLTKDPLMAVRVKKKVSFPSRRRSSVIGIDRSAEGLFLSNVCVKSVFPKSLEAGDKYYSLRFNSTTLQ